MKGILILDIIIFIATLAMVGIVATIGIITLDSFEVQANLTVENFNNSYIENVKTAILTFDQGSILIFFGLVCAAIISAYSLRTHPVFAIFSIIVLYIAAYIVAAISNMYSAFTADPLIAPTAAQFPFIQLMMDNIVAITFIVGIIIIIAMYAKSSRGEQSFG